MATKREKAIRRESATTREMAATCETGEGGKRRESDKTGMVGLRGESG